jgi:hypothetical protein
MEQLPDYLEYRGTMPRAHITRVPPRGSEQSQKKVGKPKVGKSSEKSGFRSKNDSMHAIRYGTGNQMSMFHNAPYFHRFVRMISKDTCPAVDPNLFLRVAIEGDSDAQHTTITSNEPQSRSWTFNAKFDLLAHPPLWVLARKMQKTLFILQSIKLL